MPYKIVTLPGDGIGPEVVAQGIRVLEAIARHDSSFEYTLEEKDFGGIAIDNHENPLPDDTLEAAKNSDAIILGAVGGPKWGTNAKLRPEVGLLRLRKELGLYANIRPALFPSPGLVEMSPLKKEIAEGTSIIVVRELIGGLYFGDRTEADPKGGDDARATDEMSYSVGEIKRVSKIAAFLSKRADPPLPITSVDKANVLATSRLWRSVVGDYFAAEHPEIPLNHQLVDSAAMLICANPRKLNGILLTENLFGDILSDETSVIPGSLGLLPSASISGLPDDKDCIFGLYEPIHGSAPDIAGQGIANPIATILSVAMLLRYSLGKLDYAAAVEEAVKIALDTKANGGQEIRTKDLGGHASTQQAGDEVIRQLELILRNKREAK